MVYGVNANDELNNSKLNGNDGVSSIVTNPIHNPYKNLDKNLLIDETAISTEALSLYQKEQDIKQFNALAMSDPQDLSHEEIISNLFNNGVSDLLSDESVEGLSENPKLLDDLEF